MNRRSLREHTFKLVYMREFYEADVLELQIQNYLDSTELMEYTNIEREQIVARAQAVFEKVAEEDALINQYAKSWKTGRMGKVDLSILRLAVYEIMFDEEVPDRVAINEAVELAKQYGSNESYSFINGILGKVARMKEQ